VKTLVSNCVEKNRHLAAGGAVDPIGKNEARNASIPILVGILLFGISFHAGAQEKGVSASARGASAAFTLSAGEAGQSIDRPTLRHRDSRYRICASDVLALTFPLTPEFDQTVNVQPDGFVSLAGVGDVHLEGFTTEESIAAIKEAYGKILHEPIVTLELKDFNKPYFIVNGQVHNGLNFQLITISQAVREPVTKTLLTKFGGLAMTGYYDLASRWVVNFRELIVQGNQVLVPTISNLQERDPNSVPKIYRDSYRLIFFLAIPTFAFLVVVSPLISRIWIGAYEPIFVRFVALLAVGWLVNVLSNSAYVVDLGTGALGWVSFGCVSTAILNLGGGLILGEHFGGTAVVAASMASLIFGYIIVVVSHHIENGVPFRLLLPKESAGIALSALAGALIFLPFFCSSPPPSLYSPRVSTGLLAALLTIIIIPMWLHPLRRRLLHWVFSNLTA
jgi:hypothetical protein